MTDNEKLLKEENKLKKQLNLFIKELDKFNLNNVDIKIIVKKDYKKNISTLKYKGNIKY